MRVVLVDNVLLEQTGTGFTATLQPHLGLISLIAVLRELGHDARLLDPKLDLVRGEVALGPHFYGAVAERILAGDPDVVGFTSLGCNFACTVRIAAHVRAARPALPILLGGPHASIVDEPILAAYPQFDAIVRNETEAVIGAVLDALGGNGSLADVPGVTYRREGAIARTAGAGPLLELDALPFPAYDVYPIAELALTTLRVDAGRGCPFGCTFCSTASFFGRRYRLKSPERLVGELDRLAQTYGVRRFNLTHDLFTVDARRVRAFCEEVAGRGYAWTCSARMDCVDDALLAQMRDAGCSAIYYGVETGSTRLQPLVGKHLDLALYRPIVETSLRLGLDTTVSFITGYPNELASDADATLELLGESIETYPDALSVQLHLLTPEPGTALHHEYAHALAYDGHVSDFNFPALVDGDEELIAADPASFVCHHYFAAGLPREEHLAATEGYRILYGLGHALVRAIRRAADMPFAALVRAVGRFVRGYPGPADAALVAFLEARFGAGSSFAEIVRYGRAAASLRPDDAPRAAHVDAGTPLRLARTIAPVAFGRDGAELTRRVRAGLPLDEPALPSSWWLTFGDGRAAGASFAVDRVTYELACVLREGTTRAQLEQRFETADVEARLWSLSLMSGLCYADDATAGSSSVSPSRRSIAGSAAAGAAGGTYSVDMVGIAASASRASGTRSISGSQIS